MRLTSTEPTTNCIDRATLGGFGSTLAYRTRRRLSRVPDRGPFDGRTDTPYLDRFHFLHITVDTSASFPPPPTNISRLARHAIPQEHEEQGSCRGCLCIQHDGSFGDPAIRSGRRQCDARRNFSFSTEYGPYIRKFNRQGHLLERIALPPKFLLDPVFGHQSGDINNPTDAASLELTPANNLSGRQANRGMEGLAITPDGRMLVGIMQNALIQDNGLAILGDPNAVPGRRGLNNRILTMDLETGDTHEYVYTVDAINQGRGVNEILAINDHEFLVLERDNRTRLASPPTTPNLKRIYKIDLKKNSLNDVTDVSGIASLPETGAQLGPSIVPVKKTLFIDLLKDAYKVDASHTVGSVIAEKVEGLAWGPDLPDGRHVLYVISDNDLNTEIATQIYAFAIDGTQAGIDYQTQQLPDPLFPPGQVRKALR